MRILWVKAGKLLPVHNGGNIRSYHIARHLAEKHQLTFYSYYDGEKDAQYERELEMQFPGAVSVSTGRAELRGAERVLDYALGLTSRAPYAISRFKSGAVKGRIEQWFRDQQFDVAVCDFLDAAVNFPARLSTPSVLFQHNVESEIWRRHAETEANPLKRQAYVLEYRKMLRYERNAVRDFAHIIAVSENDRQLMSAWTNAERITVVPTGVDLQNFRPAESGSPVNPVVVFVGAMDWEPNVDGVKYFCQEVWPSVLNAVPDARLRVVGKSPVRDVQRLASESVEITGRVPSVLKHLHEAAVVVVPLRIGGGTRLKIYEAMAAGKAVVSTTIGAEGLDVHHGKDIWLADDAGSFSKAAITLLQDREARARFEREAVALARQYDWEAVSVKFENTLLRVGGASPQARAVEFAAENAS